MPSQIHHPREPHNRRQHHGNRSRILSWGIPVLFLVACLALFAGVLLILKPKITDNPSTEKNHKSIGKSSASGLWPVNVEPNLPHDPGGPDGVKDPQPDITAASSTSPDIATRATSIVQDFLEATSLEERLPLIITNRTPEDIAKSSLAGKLPNHLMPELERQITVPRELLTEFYYTATFPEVSAPHPRVIAILVRQRGDDSPPKVLADPFIDLFDGDISAFGASPFDGSRTFHVLAEPIPICSDLDVPEPEQRITMRLRPHENGEELASAYTRKVSQIGEMLNQPRSTLRWGQAHPCVVTVQWNRETPEQPFLELIRLDSLTWNH